MLAHEDELADHIGSGHDFATNADQRHNTSTLLALIDLMKLYCAAALIAATSLGGCCLSASGCYAPQSAALADGTGLGQAPVADPAPPIPPKQRLSSRARDQGDPSRPAHNPAKVGNNQDKEDAGLDPDDARLERKLVICQGCGVSGN